MKEFKTILDGVSFEDTRTSLYYLSRYLKLTPTQEEYEKDFFEDDARSAPSEGIKELTRRLVACIESHEGMPAADFSDDQYTFWAEYVMDLDSQLEPEASEEAVAEANRFINSLSNANVRLKDNNQDM